MYNLLIIIPLTFVYLELSSNFEFGNLIAGLLISIGITILIYPRRYRTNWRRLPSTILALLRYVIRLIYDLIACGIRVARIVLDPALPIKPGIVAVPLRCQSEMDAALSAHAITLTPGEMVVEMDEEGVMYTSFLDDTNAEQYIADTRKMHRDILNKIFT
jgi:multicomponent Na+:H+ antiporter subunit E